MPMPPPSVPEPPERNRRQIRDAERTLALLRRQTAAALARTSEHCEAELFDALMRDLDHVTRELKAARKAKQPQIDQNTRRYRALQAAAAEDESIAAMLNPAGRSAPEARTARRKAEQRVRKPKRK